MVLTDYAFSVVVDWLIAANPNAASGMLMGLGSTAPTFNNTALGSPVDATRDGFSSKDKLGTRAILEFVVNSGDFILGSKFREIGMIQQSGANLMWRETTYSIILDGSTEVQAILNIDTL